ncbi:MULTISPECIES: flagellin [Bosea]|jgi:flagellin|uniref:flagellin N-terminal helical domain-containing protein n=1 Tax=Bosea TaxID=85413 RepID=UPI00214FB01C|nr:MULTISPECIES: flagellin [Bosea]MCR4521165.1 flagellin [Bosea sp. 47.2.35]MDR6830877.1 flagellin-like hook-associated protein FlgL [Bosea robiniae]MDR6897661.1 flagellin-like hook-associated protein FlgL [Bosea sp. BE109]MDR7141058.1 flagellin-like hook-associated protein FlgL [Bosea sp. BE168]MDR7177632.1 flagellin-like hook-associated protein FlgL [Bosea sp. BE271]
MASTILSSGVRNNLLTLQQTTAQQSVIQNRLATGKKVNSAIDNPVNYFTALSLNDRSSQLTGLLDGISNGIQTIQTASKGIDGITKLVQSLQSTVKQAQADAAQNRPTKAGTALATATEAAVTSKSLKDIALDKKLVDDNAGVANDATATYSGNVGMTAGSTDVGISIVAGSTTYEISFSAANATMRDLVNEINKSGIATAFVDEKGQLNVKGAGSEPLQVGIGVGAGGAAAITAAQGGTSNTAVGFAAADRTGAGIAGTNITSAVRSNLIDQFNDLRNKIDDLAKDSSYNGINLLTGDRLSIQFNEKTGKNQTKLDIQGSNITSDNLGIPRAINTQLAGFINFQNDGDLDKATAALTGALTSLKSLASTLGSNLSVAQTRQDFTKELANVLTTGAGNLVLADPNEEGASLLALNTRQQLSQTALSLANQADQGVLRLFG